MKLEDETVLRRVMRSNVAREKLVREAEGKKCIDSIVGIDILTTLQRL